ncbi:MAG: GAF domain-containing protein, partial [Spirochaetaceae bacterium]
MMQYFSVPESQNVPFAAMRSLLEQFFQQPAQVARIPSIVQACSTNIPLLAPMLPQVVLDYIAGSGNGLDIEKSVAASAQEMQQAALALFRQLVQEDSTLVLYMDDIQWADKASLEVFSSLSRDLKDVPLFLLASVREEEQDEEFFKANPQLVLLDVHELPQDKLPELVASILGQPDHFSDDFYHKLAQDSLGNTFYVIEIIRALLEKKILSRAVGQWILDEKAYQNYEFRVDMTGLINLRLTGFLADELQVLISAAMIGRQFSLDFLYKFMRFEGPDISLDHLLLVIEKARKELLLEELAGKDANLFVFMHDKIVEVLRGRTNAAQKETLHEKCAQVFLSGFSGDKVEDEELPVYQLAYHYNNTNNTDAIIRYNKLAYERALQQQSKKEAVYYASVICQEYRNNLELLNDERLTFMIKTTHLMQQVGYLAKSLELLHFLNDSLSEHFLGEKRIDILLNLGTAYHWQNQLPQALSNYKQAVDLAEQSGRSLSSWRPYHLLANTCFFESRYKESVQYFTRALELIPEESIHDYLMSLAVRLYAYYFLGRIKEAEEDKLELEQRLSEVPIPAYRSNFLHSLALCYNWEGDNEKGLELSLLASEEANKAGLMLSVYSALFSRMLAYFFTEKHAKLHETFLEAVEIAEKNGISIIIESYWSFQAFSELLQENFDVAQNIIDEYLPRSADSENKFAHVMFLFLQAGVHYCNTRFNAALDSINQAWQLCRERELDICSPWVMELRLKLAEVRKEDEQASGISAEADSLLQEKSGLAFLRSHARGVVEKLEGFRQSKLSLSQGDSSISVFKEKLQLENIVKTSQMISSILKIDVLLNSVLQAMMETTGAQRGVLQLIDYQAAGSPYFFSNIDQSDESFPAIQTVLADQQDFFKDSIEGVVVSSKELAEHHVLSAVCCPLVIKGKPIGMVYLDSQYISGLFSLEELRLLSIFTSQAAIAIENAISFEKEKEARSAAEATLRAFQLFVPPQFMSAIASEGIDKIRLGNAVERQVSILFCDIRNFTAISEGMRPETLMAFLNTYMETMVGKSIADNGGFIDKFIGDAVMAIFETDYSDGAVQTAIDIQRTLVEYNTHLSKAEEHREIRAGVGVNTGTVIMGTVGTHTR